MDHLQDAHGGLDPANRSLKVPGSAPSASGSIGLVPARAVLGMSRGSSGTANGWSQASPRRGILPRSRDILSIVSPARIEVTERERAIYVTVSRRHSRQARPARRRGVSQRRDRRALDTPRQIVSKWRQRFFDNASRASTRSRAAGAQPAFPPNVVVEVKRIACERPMDARRAAGALVAARSASRGRWRADSWRPSAARTLWRWLDADAIRPWRHRSWLFPRDPQFAERAGPILDLYARRGRVARWDRTTM